MRKHFSRLPSSKKVSGSNPNLGSTVCMLGFSPGLPLPPTAQTHDCQANWSLQVWFHACFCPVSDELVRGLPVSLEVGTGPHQGHVGIDYGRTEGQSKTLSCASDTVDPRLLLLQDSCSYHIGIFEAEIPRHNAA